MVAAGSLLHNKSAKPKPGHRLQQSMLTLETRARHPSLETPALGIDVRGGRGIGTPRDHGRPAVASVAADTIGREHRASYGCSPSG